MSGIPNLPRFMPVSSALNAPVGLRVEPKLPGQVLSVMYSFTDTANAYNPLSNPIQSRIAIIAGRFGDVLQNFTLAYNLNSYRVLLDMAINDPGPTPLLIPPDAEDGVTIETDGVTVLLAAPIVTGATGTLFIAKLQVTSKGLVTPVMNRLKQLQTQDDGQSQSSPSATATASGSGTSSGSGSAGGSGGGTVSGGGSKIRPKL